MTRAALAARDLIARLTAGIGVEGAFLAIGTASLAVGSTFLSPAGPWFVVGGVALFVGIALVMPRSR